MAISLQKPLGTDVYSISVFNANASIIEETINNLLQSVDTNSDNITKRLPFYYIDNNTTIDNVLSDGIYYILNDVQGTLPEDLLATNNCILFSIGQTENTSLQLLFSSSAIYTRTVNSTSDISTWNSLNSSVIDNLTTQDANKALSANQGYILNNTKLSINFPNVINIDTVQNSGIYICDKTSTTGTIPLNMLIDTISNTNNHFVLECYGNINETTVLQRLSDANTITQAYRFSIYDSEQDLWSWSEWQQINNNSGGGEGSNISLELVDI